MIVALLERVRPITVSEDTDLPEPDSPTIPSVRPALDVVGDAVDRLDQAVVGVEVDVQVADLESSGLAVMSGAPAGRGTAYSDVDDRFRGR